MLKTEQEISGDGDNGKVILAENHYNELGQLMLKKLHSANDTSFVQDIDYVYDVRGWLTKINNFEDTTQNKLYAQSLAYNANGNISNINWKNTMLDNDGWIDPTNKLKYAFAYDGLNRLDKADYYEVGNAANDGNFDVGFAYDLNGNITSLQRDGNKNDSNAPAPSYGLIDNLTYTYPTTSNLLTSVSDAAIGVNHGLEYKASAGDFIYDDNGNATTVPGKGSIDYNYLNLPEKIFDGSNEIEYLYDASGNKLKKTYNSTANSYYQGSVLEISGQDIILTGEGRAVYANSQWNYEYDLKDHLGNTRVSFGVDTTRAVPLQYKDYYPFGMEMAQWYGIEGTPTKYLYNGKELQDEHGLDWYDYGARFYDPAIARWHVVDPLAEKYYSMSPYNYVANNPLIFIDPDGTKIEWGDNVTRKEKRIIRKSLRRLKGSVFKNAWKTLKKSDYTYNLKTGNSMHLAEFRGNYAQDMSVLGLGIQYENGKNEGGDLVFDFGNFLSVHSSQDKVDYLTSPVLEEVMHATQYDHYVHKYGMIQKNLPEYRDMEIEAKNLNGIVKQQSNIPFAKGTDSILEKHGSQLYNGKAFSSKEYFNKAKEWTSHPKTHSAYKKMKQNNFTPELLLKTLKK